MRLLILCERVGTTGGMERYLQTVLPALAARGHEILVAARQVDSPGAFGVRTMHLPWPDEHEAPSRQAGEELSATIGRFAPDVVVAHNVLDACILEAAARAPRTIHHLHDHRTFCPNGDRVYPRGAQNCGVPMGGACLWHSLVHGCVYGPRSSTRVLLGRRQAVADFVRAADAVVVLSAFMAGMASANACPPERIHTIAPPLPPEAFATVVAPQPAHGVVLFAGRAMPSKGLLSLLAAIARIDAHARPKVAVAGEGPELAAAVAFAAQNGCRIEPLGHLDPAALRAAMDEASIVAVPSLWAEPFGLTGIEAQARGRPVVAYDVGATGEWMDGGGALVPRNDTRALARQIARYLRDPGSWSEASRSGYAHAQRSYSAGEHVAQLEHLYAGSSRPGGGRPTS